MNEAIVERLPILVGEVPLAQEGMDSRVFPHSILWLMNKVCI